MSCAIIIPTYQPDQCLAALVDQLALVKSSIIIINDGSDDSFLPLFDALAQRPFVTVLHHAVNQGKGEALKTGFRYFLEHYPEEYLGVVTADADGQHSPEDIQHLCQTFSQHPTTLILGSRTFGQGVPWRSLFGNKITCFFFRMLVGQSLQDTQTGLRALPRSFLNTLLQSRLKGYDFELEMLLYAFTEKIPLKEIPIQTIYYQANQNSHFHPVKDAIKIYLVFFHFFWKKNKPKIRKGK